MGKLLDNGELLPIEWANEDIMGPIDNRLVEEIYVKCQRGMTFSRDSSAE